MSIILDLIVFCMLQSIDIIFIVFNVFFLIIYSYYRKLLNNFFFVSNYFIKSIYFLFFYFILKLLILNFYFPIAEYFSEVESLRSFGTKSINMLSNEVVGNTFITYYSGVHCSNLYSLKMQILFLFVSLIGLIYFYLFFYYNKKINIQIIHVFFFTTTIYLLSWVIPFQNLFYIFFTFETLTYLLIGLVALIPNKYSSEALSKFFIISSICGVLTLFGILQFYILTGSLNLVSLYQFTVIFGSNDSNFIGFFVFLIIFSILSKLGVLPISWYVFDLYQSSILPITFLLAVILKIGVFFFINLFFLFLDFYYSEFLYFVFFFLSVFSAFFGCFLTLKEYDLNRFFSTNSIMSSGFLLSTFYFSVNPYNLNIAGFQYLLAYAINMIALFYILLNVIKLESYDSSQSMIVNLNDFKGFSKINLPFSIFITIIFFSFIGIPPLAGFVGKFAILWTLLKYNKFFLFFILLLISIISSFFYLRIIQFVWFHIFSSKQHFFGYSPVLNFFLSFRYLLTGKNNFFKFYNINIVIMFFISFLVFFLTILLNFFYFLYYIYYFYEIHKVFTSFLPDSYNTVLYNSFFLNKDTV